jgi:hypothetical protein
MQPVDGFYRPAEGVYFGALGRKMVRCRHARVAGVRERCEVVGVVGICFPRCGSIFIGRRKNSRNTENNALFRLIRVLRPVNAPTGVVKLRYVLAVAGVGFIDIKASREEGFPFAHHTAFVVVALPAADDDVFISF